MPSTVYTFATFFTFKSKYDNDAKIKDRIFTFARALPLSTAIIRQTLVGIGIAQCE